MCMNFDVSNAQLRPRHCQMPTVLIHRLTMAECSAKFLELHARAQPSFMHANDETRPCGGCVWMQAASVKKMRATRTHRRLGQDDGAPASPKIPDDDDDADPPANNNLLRLLLLTGSMLFFVGASALVIALAFALGIEDPVLDHITDPRPPLPASAPPLAPQALPSMPPPKPPPTMPPSPPRLPHPLSPRQPLLPMAPPAAPVARAHRCRMNCPDRIPLRMAQAAALPESSAVDEHGEWTSGSNNCVDGSRMTFCLIEGRQAAEQAWLSARFVNDDARSMRSLQVAVTLYKPWGGKFAPYEVWLGDSLGDRQHWCNTSHVEPSHHGAPASIVCHDAVHHTFATVVQIGPPRRWQVSELEVFASAPSTNWAADTDAMAAVTAGERRRQIAWRFETGRPSNVLGEAGVLVHVQDGNEDPERPWLLCEHDMCSRGSVDAWSTSLISRRVPWLFTDVHGGGFIVAPDATILCAFPSDVGTLGSAQRLGHCSALHDHGFVFTTLEAALQPQYNGSWRQQWVGAAQYNEVLVSASWWREHMPWALEAFLCAFPCPSDNPMRWQHATFLAYYNLTRDEVPLLQYRCAPEDPTWDHGRDGSTREPGDCFEEILW